MITRRAFSSLAVFAAAFAPQLWTQKLWAQKTVAPGKPAVPDAETRMIMFEQAEWHPMFPEWKHGSPQVAMLHVDPVTNATHLMIKAPAGMHVPLHWHSANEMNFVHSGVMSFACDGRKMRHTPGAFNYFPAKHQHEAWVEPGADCVTLSIVDGAWDVNWVNGPPVPPA